MDHLAFLAVKHTNGQEFFPYPMGHLAFSAINHTDEQEDFPYPMGHLAFLAINHTNEQQVPSHSMTYFMHEMNSTFRSAALV